MTKVMPRIELKILKTRTEREYMDGIRQHKLVRGHKIAAETDEQINRRINDGVDMEKLDHLAPAQKDSARIAMRENMLNQLSQSARDVMGDMYAAAERVAPCEQE